MPFYTNETLETAAKWWGQFFLGADPSFMPIDLDFTPTKVTEEQYKNFIRVFKEKLENRIKNREFKEYRDDSNDDSHLELGDSSFYEPSTTFQQARREAGIQTPTNYEFRRIKLGMKIFKTGQIQVNGVTVAETNPEYKLYDERDFSPQAQMKITGNPFCCVPINLDEHKRVYDCNSSTHNIREFNLEWLHPKIPLKTVYAILHLSDFNGSKEEFFKKTPQEWQEIFTDPNKLKAVLKAEASNLGVNYKINPPVLHEVLKGDEFYGFGTTTIENIGSCYYEHTTGPVTVMTAAKNGNLNDYSLTPVKSGDYLFERPEDKKLYCFSQSQNALFQAKKLIDNEREDLSLGHQDEKVLSHR